jgi:potassium-transporting ATPase KdpC subunit
MTTFTIDDRASLRAPLLLAVLVLLGFGLLYSLVGTAMGRLLFPWQATGSMIVLNGQARGSELVAQPFNDDRYFQARPSAANYDAMAAAGSNQARSNPELRKRIDEAIAAVAAREGVTSADVPGELATQSGSGMDPHLSPRAVQIQAARVAHARGLAPSVVAGMIQAHIETPQFGVLGQPRVNVLRLNLALDALGQAE